MRNIKIVSIYSGCGGIDIGFEEAGFNTVFATDIWNVACKTFLKNFEKTEVRCDNIVNINFKKIRNKHKKINGLIGGPPCPPFSKSRFYLKEKNRGLNDNEGFITITNYMRAVNELKPDFFLFENVHGFIYKPHSSALKLLEQESDKLGYKLKYKVLNAANYGIPQKGKDLFVLEY